RRNGLAIVGNVYVFDHANDGNRVALFTMSFTGKFHTHWVGPSIRFCCSLIDDKSIAVGGVARNKEAAVRQLDIKYIQVIGICINGIERNISCSSITHPLSALLSVHLIRKVRSE